MELEVAGRRAEEGERIEEGDRNGMKRNERRWRIERGRMSWVYGIKTPEEK